MAENTLQVEVVAADRLVWSGEATVVNARTAGGEIGILANHMPVLSLLAPGAVEVDTPDGETSTFAVDEGILSVANNRVSVLASHAEVAADIDLSSARSDLESARSDASKSESEIHRLEARVRAAERAS
jgi:F-type H+-transporting ATPase subunit epsilon